MSPRDTTQSRVHGPDDASTTWGSGERADGEPTELATGASLGRYTILRRLGAGAMGVVYSAYDPELDRKVALKLLRPRTRAVGGADEGALRLLREAKALARLSHPNVVAIHDVGALAGGVFIAMEFVDGRTLTTWLKEQPRTWREISEVMRRAGEGLAAAHEAGLIHRDFKPDNVVIGHDSRVRVLDFGLARAATDAPDPAEPELEGSGVHRSSSIHVGITSTGMLVGTPAYMAPEQHIGQPADARSDLFAYCVTFYQALYGERPFDGNDLPTLAANVIRGRIRPPPAGARVPSWLHRAIVQGLHVSPSERYPSMAALLLRLQREPAALRRRGLALVAVPALLLGLAVGALRGAAEPPCQRARDHLAGVWDAARKDAIARAFAATDLPYAATAWQSVAAALDDRAERWVTAHTDACEATQVRGEQSAAMLDLRMLCLDRHRAELAALTEVLAAADATVVEHAIDGVGRLGDLTACADARALLEAAPPPQDPAARAAVAAVRGQIAQALALDVAGKWAQALELARAARDAAAELAYGPLEADALLVVADLEQQLGDPGAATATLGAAALAAAAARHDHAVARAYIDLILVAGLRRARYDEARWAGHAADVAIRRAIGEDPTSSAAALLQARRALGLAVVLHRTGDADEARALAESALATFERELGEDHPLVHRTLTALALIHAGLGELPRARAYLDRALAIARRVGGPEHPSVAAVLTNLANLAARERRLDEALALAREAVALRDRVLAPDHADRALSLQELAAVEAELGRHDDAYAHYQQALEIFERRPHASADHRAALLNNLATLDLERGALAPAREHFAGALAAFRAAYGPDHQHTATAAANLAEVLLQQGRPAEAAALLDPAVSTLRRVDAGGPLLAYALALAGRAALLAGDPAAARAALVESIALHEALPERALSELAGARLDLARAVLALGEPERARALAEAARADLAALPPAEAAPLDAELAALLAEHP